MFCTTFLSAPCEEILDSISRPDAGLVPLQCLVLSRDDLNEALPRPCLNTLLKIRGDRPSFSTEDVLSEGALGHGRGHGKLAALTRGRGLADMMRSCLTITVKKLSFCSQTGSKTSLGHFQKHWHCTVVSSSNFFFSFFLVFSTLQISFKGVGSCVLQI